MTLPGFPARPAPPQAAGLPDRPPAAAAEPRPREFAPARSAGYALFSRLLASPFDESFAGHSPLPDDLGEALALLERQLPYGCDFSALAAAGRAVLAHDPRRFAKEYGALFEIGIERPPLPIREELALGDVAGPPAKQEVVRFYDFFGYRLAEARQWAPDHLSVELEFLHLLCYREAEAEGDEQARPFARAQRDFLERHPLAVLPVLRRALAGEDADPCFTVLLATLHDWLKLDLAWRKESLEEDP